MTNSNKQKVYETPNKKTYVMRDSWGYTIIWKEFRITCFSDCVENAFEKARIFADKYDAAALKNNS